ncbi:MAG: hypothetical protein J6V32_02425, partial [Elusimicrobiaceae bacterium]|nr:hypothetical protein [Elusimicrobiaceae bacterium]
RFRSNMKNFFPILTLFVNGANGRDKQQIKKYVSFPNVLGGPQGPVRRGLGDDKLFYYYLFLLSLTHQPTNKK